MKFILFSQEKEKEKKERKKADGGLEGPLGSLEFPESRGRRMTEGQLMVLCRWTAEPKCIYLMKFVCFVPLLHDRWAGFLALPRHFD